ncbi:hypothetical protein VTL71DRAFT_8175 [Oculimacula yallundae]|uniref:BTB domain-containing protein n=1 Tax=Oculimacula yallundae TaxID=86028 RepID=A0ABR4CX32_9HELO
MQKTATESTNEREERTRLLRWNDGRAILDSMIESLNQFCSKRRQSSITTCGEVVQILVGPTEAKLSCHKALLGFTSEFFDAALCGDFRESKTNIVRLPEETPEAVAGFLTWACSGHIESPTCPEELWALGERLRSPKFMDEVMHLIFAVYGRYERWLSARGAEVACDQTMPESKLRKYVFRNVSLHGPLCKAAIKDEFSFKKEGIFERGWLTSIKGGGELVSHMALGRGARKPRAEAENGIQLCFGPDMQDKYLVGVVSVKVEDFIQGKLGAR